MNVPTLALITLLAATPAQAQRHDHTGHLGAAVMPFDLGRSTHVFTPTPDGGTQVVVSKDRDPAQVALIREHLQKEGAAFTRGDYTDPAAIHGAAMPGLAALQASGGRVRVLFSALPDGARLTFTTADPALVAALHRWFAAQVADHGSDAMMGH